MIIGFFLENKFFQIPAAASITIFFAIPDRCVRSIYLFFAKLECSLPDRADPDIEFVL
jgi:hypothetical protein